MVGETNSSCAATVRISRDPASAVRFNKPNTDAAASTKALRQIVFARNGRRTTPRLYPLRR